MNIYAECFHLLCGCFASDYHRNIYDGLLERWGCAESCNTKYVNITWQIRVFCHSMYPQSTFWPFVTSLTYILPFIFFIRCVLRRLAGFLRSISFVVLTINQSRNTRSVTYSAWDIKTMTHSLLMSMYRENWQPHFYCFFLLFGKHHSSRSSPDDEKHQNTPVSHYYIYIWR